MVATDEHLKVNRLHLLVLLNEKQECLRNLNRIDPHAGIYRFFRKHLDLARLSNGYFDELVPLLEHFSNCVIHALDIDARLFEHALTVNVL